LIYHFPDTAGMWFKKTWQKNISTKKRLSLV
jgi:hypothetical protein